MAWVCKKRRRVATATFSSSGYSKLPLHDNRLFGLNRTAMRVGGERQRDDRPFEPDDYRKEKSTISTLLPSELSTRHYDFAGTNITACLASYTLSLSFPTNQA